MVDKNFGQNDPKILDYVEKLFKPEDEILAEIRLRTASLKLPQIQVSKTDARHLEVLALAVGAKSAVEIGTLAGYSGVSLLRGMGPKGRLYTFDADWRHLESAKVSFAHAGFLEQVELFVGPALSNLSKIESKGPFDLVFVDADKANYPNYLEWAYQNLKLGGLLIGDNTFGWGMIADHEFEDPADQEAISALDQFNRAVARGDRFRGTILPTGEGLTLGVKIA